MTQAQIAQKTFVQSHQILKDAKVGFILLVDDGEYFRHGINHKENLEALIRFKNALLIYVTHLDKDIDTLKSLENGPGTNIAESQEGDAV